MKINIGDRVSAEWEGGTPVRVLPIKGIYKGLTDNGFAKVCTIGICEETHLVAPKSMRRLKPRKQPLVFWVVLYGDGFPQGIYRSKESATKAASYYSIPIIIRVKEWPEKDSPQGEQGPSK